MDSDFIHPTNAQPTASVATPAITPVMPVGPTTPVTPVVMPPSVPVVAPAQPIGFRPVVDVQAPARPASIAAAPQAAVAPASPVVLPVVAPEPLSEPNHFAAALDASPAPTPVKRSWKLGGGLRLAAVCMTFIALTTGGAFLFNKGQQPQTPSARGVVVPEQDLGSGIELTELEGTLPEAQTLIVNGDIRLQGALNFASGSYLGSFVQGNLTGNQTYTLPDASGEVCLSANNCNYLTAAQLVATGLVTQQQLTQAQSTLVTANQLADLQQQLAGIVVTSPNFTGGTGISIIGDVIQNSGVLTLNGQSGAVSLTGGSGILVSGTTISNNGVLTVNGQSGAVTFTGGTGISLSGTTINNEGVLSLGGQTGALNLISGPGISISGLTVSNNGVTSTQGLTGNVVFTAGTGIDITGTAVSNTGVTLLTGTTNQVNISGGTGSVTLSLPQSIATTSTPTFGGMTLTGALTATSITSTAGLTVGSVAQTLTLQGAVGTTLVASNGINSTTLSFQSPTANVVYRFGTAAAGTYDVCTTTGNCSGVGGGVTTPGGTAGTVPKFTSSQGLGDSNITDDGTTVTINGDFDVTGVINGQLVSPDAHFTGDVTIDLDLDVAGTLSVNTITPTGALTVGSSGQSLLLQGSAVTLSNTNSGITNSLVFATPTGSNKTVTIPNMSGTICLTSGNCAGVGGTGDVLQGGNSFGTAMTVGTNDNFSLAFETNGSTAMTILTNGNVGIGTATPGSKLEIAGALLGVANGQALNLRSSTLNSRVYQKFDNNNSGNLYLGAESNTGASIFSDTLAHAAVLGTDNSNPLQFAVNNTAKLTVLYTGNVGIGTAAPTSQLELSENNATGSRQRLTLTNTALGGYGSVINFRGRQNFGTNDIVDAAQIKVDGQGNYGSGAQTSSYMAFSTVLSGTLAERLRVTANGNVGIGTSSPDGKLHVSAGHIVIDNTYYYQIKNNANTAVAVLQMDSSNHLALGATSGMGNTNIIAGTGDINLTTASGTGLTLLSSSKRLRIGSGTGEIYVDTSTTNPYIDLFGARITANAGHGFIYNTYSNTSTDFHAFQIGGTNALRITPAADVGIGTITPSGRLHVTGAQSTGHGAVAKFVDEGGWANDGGPTVVIQQPGNYAQSAILSVETSANNNPNALLRLLQAGTGKYITATNGSTEVFSIGNGGDLTVTRTTGTSNVLRSFVGAESAARFVLDASGGLYWGTGSTSQDVNLYRSAADVLKTDDTLYGAANVRSDGAIIARVGSAMEVSIGASVLSPNPGITFGSGADTNLYRSAANTLRTDDDFFGSRLYSTGGLIEVSAVSPNTYYTQLDTNGLRFNRAAAASYIDQNGALGSLNFRLSTTTAAVDVAALTLTTSYASFSQPLGIGTSTMTAGSGLNLASGTTAANGIAFGTDVNLYRVAADILQTNDSFYAVSNIRASSGNSTQLILGAEFNTGLPGITFGSGTDTNLYRRAANELATDDTLEAVGRNIISQFGAAQQTTIGLIGPSNEAGILFGSAGDTNLYRGGANELRTDDALRVTNDIYGMSSVYSRFGQGDQAGLTVISGQAALQLGTDTNLYRSAADILRTDDSFYALNLVSRVGTANQVELGASTSFPMITFGSAADTNLYRASANTLATDDNFAIRGGVVYFGASDDTAIYRSAADTLRTDDSMIIQPAGGSASALLIRDNSSGVLFTADTTNTVVKIGMTGSASLSGARLLVTSTEVTTTLRVGDGTNGVEFSGSGAPVYRGTARPTKRIALSPEFPGMVLSASGSNNTGTMTAGYDGTNFHNYYNWNTTQATNQTYDLVLRIPVPQDYSALTASPQLCMYGYTSDTTNGTLTVTMRDSANAAVTLASSGAYTPGSTSTWTETCRAISGTPTITAGGWITVSIRMQAPQNGNTRVGELRLDYLGGF